MARARPIAVAVASALLLTAALVWSLVYGPLRAHLSRDASSRCAGCNLLLVVLDAARADHFGCYGYPRSTTPNIDRLAEESVVFEQAFSDASFTIASTASLLSGLSPARHGVLKKGGVLSQEATTLAEVLDGRGYRTAAFTENPLIDPRFGYGQGFQRFRQFLPRRAATDGVELDLSESREHVAEMLEWIDAGASAAPFFLYAHFLRPHNPYHALPEHAGRFSQGYSGDLRGGTRELVAINVGFRETSDRDLQQLVDLYDENLFSADALVGELTDALRERGLLESTIMALVSDHGEGFLEHGRLLHALQVFQEDVHIPFLIRFPEALAVRPGREQAMVQLTDLMPTVLAALGMGDGVETSGWNLMPLLTGLQGTGRPEPVVSHGAAAISLRDDALKFILVTQGAQDERGARLFDLSRDPQEQRDLASHRESDAARMRARLDAVLEQQREQAIATSERTLDAERIRQLRALGYLDEESPTPR
jgi:arylsulfatase A-like enzyme